MRRERSKTHQAANQPRRARRIHEEAHDTYGIRGKLPEPTACPTCRAVYQEGRWVWVPVPSGAHVTPCPACRRIADDYPAGVVTIAGSFAGAHREEIENLVRNLEQHEKEEHPLKRIFSIDESEEGLSIRTTDSHLAREIGQALFHAYRGELEDPGPQSEGLMRVHWTRE